MLKVHTFVGSWSQDGIGLHLMLHTEVAVAALGAELNTGLNCESKGRNLIDL